MRPYAALAVALLAVLSLESAVAQTRVKPNAPTPPQPTFDLKAPQAKPDFVILHASAVGGTNNKFMVKMQNNASVDAPSALLQSVNMTPGNSGAATTPVPPIKAGSFVWVAVTLNKPADRGDRILLFADHNNAVAESKENNNKYGFNW